MTIRKTIAVSMILSSLFPFASLSAQPPDIVVTAPSTEIAQWSTRISRDLDQNMAFPNRVPGREIGSGIVRVQFRAGESGEPTQIAVRKSSGSRQLDAAGVRAVSRVSTLYPLPNGIANGQMYEAALLFATDQQAHDRQMAMLKAEAARRNHWLAKHPAEVAAAPILLTSGR